MYTYTEYLEEQGITLEDLEPWEVKQLCQDVAFRALCDWCTRARRGELPGELLEEGRFDRDELGIDPEEDV